MVISLKGILRPAICILLLFAALLWGVWTIRNDKAIQTKMGGTIHLTQYSKQADDIVAVSKTGESPDYSERFQRPSKSPALKLKYQFGGSEGFDEKNTPHIAPGYPKTYQSAEDVIQAYYSILKEAANMAEYAGGCGTIGLGSIPYPFAYELFTPSKKHQMSLEEFIKSFAGVGHTTLLKMFPAYRPAGTPDNIQYYMVETEILASTPFKVDPNQGGYFVYYTGIVTVEHLPAEGWKIKAVDYIQEDFFCAPYHHWDWDARSLVETVYRDWYGIIDKIEKIETDGPLLHVYASSKKMKYRFDFVRVTNGYDLLLHENIEENSRWKEVNILKEEHQFYKFSIYRFKM